MHVGGVVRDRPRPIGRNRRAQAVRSGSDVAVAVTIRSVTETVQNVGTRLIRTDLYIEGKGHGVESGQEVVRQIDVAVHTVQSDAICSLPLVTAVRYTVLIVSGRVVRDTSGVVVERVIGHEPRTQLGRVDGGGRRRVDAETGCQQRKSGGRPVTL